MLPGTKKRISQPETPVSASEKPSRVLKESRTTTAALALLEKGIKLIYQKEFRKARQEFEAILADYRGEAEIVARARSYLQICAREEAANKRPVVTNDQLYTLGVMEHNRGNYAGAIAYFEQALEKHATDYVYYSLAASKAMKNDFDEALEYLKRAIELNDDNRIYAKNDPDFSSLHVAREFVDLVGLKSV